MSNLRDLRAKLARLDLEIEATLGREKAQAIRDIQAKMDEWDIRPKDLQRARSGRRYEPIKSGRYVPKYREPVSGATWSGKGREPSWIAGKDRALFALVQPDALFTTTS